MDLANALVYKGQLEEGSAAVGAARLVLPQAVTLQQVGWFSFLRICGTTYSQPHYSLLGDSLCASQTVRLTDIKLHMLLGVLCIGGAGACLGVSCTGPISASGLPRHRHHPASSCSRGLPGTWWWGHQHR